MSYHVSIIRTKHGRVEPIRPSEVIGLAKTLADVRTEPASLTGADLDLVIDSALASYRFVLQRGRLWTQNPDEAELSVMLDIANELGARVRGDELETYRTPTDTFSHPDDLDERFEDAKAVARVKSETRRKQLLLNLTVIGIFALLAGAVVFLQH